MDANATPKVAPMAANSSRQFPHPSPLPSPRRPVKDTLSSLNPQDELRDPINDLFLTALTRIFAKKYALGMMTTSRLLDPSSGSADEVRAELQAMLEDLKRAQKWLDTTMRQTEKALKESAKTPPTLQPKSSSVSGPKTSRVRQIFSSFKRWFERISSN
jgi:hypothetical protein